MSCPVSRTEARFSLNHSDYMLGKYWRTLLMIELYLFGFFFSALPFLIRWPIRLFCSLTGEFYSVITVHTMLFLKKVI